MTPPLGELAPERPAVRIGASPPAPLNNSQGNPYR